MLILCMSCPFTCSDRLPDPHHGQHGDSSLLVSVTMTLAMLGIGQYSYTAIPPSAFFALAWNETF